MSEFWLLQIIQIRISLTSTLYTQSRVYEL